MANDFLLTFSVDGRQALQMMDQIAQRAQQLEQRLNSLGKGGGTSSNILRNIGLTPQQIRSTDTELDRLMGRLDRLRSDKASRNNLGLPISRSSLEQEAIAYDRLAKAAGKTHPEYQQFVANSQKAAHQARNMRSSLDDATGSFGHHTRRIVESLVIYEALGRAVQGVTGAISNIVNIDRESRRLEAVLDIGAEAGNEFVQGLGQIAIRTVTPFEDLVGEADRMAAAFLGIEDPAQRAAAALKLADDVGRITTVTQRGAATETENLIGILKQLAGDDLNVLEDILNKVTVAGGGSSTLISDILDALRVSGQAAKTAGVDIDTLIALEQEFIVQTGRAGSEVGNVFKTMFATIQSERAEKAIASITGGLVKTRDAAGNLRSVRDVLLELRQLVDRGIIDELTLGDLFKELVPPLNPGAKSDLELVFNSLSDIRGVVEDISSADNNELNDLVGDLNDALGAEFQRLLIEVQVRLQALFQGPVIAAGGEFLRILKFIADALLAIPAPVVILLAKFLGVLAVMKGVVFVGQGLTAILGIRGLIGAFRGAGGGAAVAAGQLTLFGGAAAGAAGLARGLTLMLSRLLPLLAAFMAIDFAQQVGAQQEALKGQVGGLAEGRNIEELEALRAQLVDQQQAGAGNPFFDLLKGVTVDPALNDSISEVDRLIASLKERGGDAKVAMTDLTGSFTPTTDAAEDLNQALADQQSEFDKAFGAASQYAESIANMSAEERLALDAAQLNVELADARAAAIKNLDQELANHNITLEEHTAGLDTVNKVSDLASRMVALYGDQLAAIPGLEGAAKEGTDKLSEALFNMILTGEGNIDQLLRQGEALVQFGLTHGEIADHLNANPLIVRMAVQTISADDLRNNPELGIAQRDARKKAFGNEFATGPQNIADNLAAELQNLLASFGGAIRNAAANSGKTSFGTGKDFPTSSGASARETPILDIGDLNANQVAQLVAIAAKLRDQIPGESARSSDEVVALIKDAKFLQTVKGIDDRLLRLALEQLTDVEKERLDLEKQRIANENLLKNLQTNVGPLGALISQPTAFGVGGNLALGQGLNVDPSAGNFTINVPVALQGTAANIQQMVYEAIAKAIQDSLRVGG